MAALFTLSLLLLALPDGLAADQHLQRLQQRAAQGSHGSASMMEKVLADKSSTALGPADWADSADPAVLAYSVSRDDEHETGRKVLKRRKPEGLAFRYMDEIAGVNSEQPEFKLASSPYFTRLRQKIAADLAAVAARRPPRRFVLSVNVHSYAHLQSDFLSKLLAEIDSLLDHNKEAAALLNGRVALTCEAPAEIVSGFPKWVIPAFNLPASAYFDKSARSYKPSLNLTPFGWSARFYHGGAYLTELYEAFRKSATKLRDLDAMQAWWSHPPGKGRYTYGYNLWMSPKVRDAHFRTKDELQYGFVSTKVGRLLEDLARVNKLLGFAAGPAAARNPSPPPEPKDLSL